MLGQSLGRVRMSRSKVKVSKGFSSPLTMHCKASHTPYAANDVTVAAGGDGLTGVHYDGGVRAVYVWKNIFAL